MKDTVLLIVDVQTALVQGHPYHGEKMIGNIKSLISFCRKNQVEVIYVRHDGGTGDELEYNSSGWQIEKEVEPLDGEMIFDKRYNSAFKSTGLKEHLDHRNIKNIILVGMQTEYCIDATCKTAFEYGYNIIIPEESTATYDNSYFTGKALYEFYMYGIWKDRFAKVASIAELESSLSPRL